MFFTGRLPCQYPEKSFGYPGWQSFFVQNSQNASFHFSVVFQLFFSLLIRLFHCVDNKIKNPHYKWQKLCAGKSNFLPFCCEPCGFAIISDLTATYSCAGVEMYLYCL